MKLFYLTALGLAILLSLAPFLLLEPSALESGNGLVVAFNTYPAKIKSKDPASCGDTLSAAFQGYVYEGLYCYDYFARPLKLVPQLAESMPEVSKDNLVYTFKLKKGVKYHRNACFGVKNGEPQTRTVKAEDFVLAFKRIADSHMSVDLALTFVEDKIVGLREYRDKTKRYDPGDFSRYDLPMEGVKALDEHTLQIRLSKPFPQFIYVLAVNCYAPVPRELVDYWLAGEGKIPIRQRDPEIRTCEAVVGTGAYFMEKFVDGGDIIFRRNPDFRPEFYPFPPDPNTLGPEEKKNAEADIAAGLYKDAGKRLPLIDVNVNIYVPELNPEWELFRKKLTDISSIPRQMYGQLISPSKELTEQWAKQGIRLVKYSEPAIYWYVFNLQDPVVGSSKSLRQALSLAFNVEAYIEVLRNGRAIRATNYVPSNFEGHDLAGPSPYARFDLDAAKAKLVEAKKELAAKGLLGPNGEIPPLTMYLGGQDEESRRQGEFCQQQFGHLGIDLKIELDDWPTLQEKVQKRQCQIFTLGWHADYPDPENFLQLFYGPNIKNGNNTSGYSNPKFDALYKKISVMQPSPERTAIYAEMIRMLCEDCPVILEDEPVRFVLFHGWMQNVKRHPIGYGFAKFYRLDTELRKQLGGRL